MSGLLDQINTLIVNVSSMKNQLLYMKKVLAAAPANEDIQKETEQEFRRVRRFYETTILASSLFPFGTQYVYVWELQGGKYYVGWSENLSRRLDEHISEEGSIWTRKYSPIGIVEIVRGDKQTEKMKTLQYMKKKGFENVRGAGWCSFEYKSLPVEVQKYLEAEQTFPGGYSRKN
jgi:predicted GIY-YIG superfamily endonuclease